MSEVQTDVDHYSANRDLILGRIALVKRLCIPFERRAIWQKKKRCLPKKQLTATDSN
jgi:hypothetical protein